MQIFKPTLEYCLKMKILPPYCHIKLTLQEDALYYSEVIHVTTHYRGLPGTAHTRTDIGKGLQAQTPTRVRQGRQKDMEDREVKPAKVGSYFSALPSCGYLGFFFSNRHAGQTHLQDE